jgi:hypothetical protein
MMHDAILTGSGPLEAVTAPLLAEAVLKILASVMASHPGVKPQGGRTSKKREVASYRSPSHTIGIMIYFGILVRLAHTFPYYFFCALNEQPHYLKKLSEIFCNNENYSKPLIRGLGLTD